MKVRITGRAWFTPDNQLLKDGVHEVNDDWDLPSNVEAIQKETSKVK
jgi:hypothetical protein